MVLGLSWLALTGIGCRTQGSDVGRVRPKVFDPGEGPINSIRLFTSPVLFNLDGEPGPDAFKARVYAVRDSAPKPVPFTKGTLEIIIFDEASNRDQQDPPRQVWSFSGADLNRHRLQTSIGFSYDFTLEIDKSKPLPDKVSVVAKFTPPDGGSIFAKPVSITVEP
ncbi:MAG: hypothetical protein QF749_01800 [Verrucomicrobiota bacterium]|nr:hypothetical protein [Verrucomicrobiota bacterium]